MKQLLLISAILLCALAALTCGLGMVSGWADKPLGGNSLENAISILKGLLSSLGVALFSLSTALLAVLAARRMQSDSSLSPDKTTLCRLAGIITILIGFSGLAQQLFLLFGPNGFYAGMSPKFQAVHWVAGALNAFVQTVAFGFIIFAAPRFLRPKS